MKLYLLYLYQNWLILLHNKQKCVIHAGDSIRHCNTDYSGLEWSNINSLRPSDAYMRQ